MRAIILPALLVLFSAFPARGQDGSIFTVPRVPVFAEAETAAAAQGQAQAQGRKVAMDLLLRRLTAEEDWGYLPRLALERAPGDAALGTAAAAAADERLPGGPALAIKRPVRMAASDLPRLELSFAPYDEKTSRTTYRAEVTYRFNPDQVRALLTEAGLPYSESQTRRALVLPVLETEAGLYLWEAKNPWARAWLARPFVNELTPLILPRGSQQDVGTLTAEEAKSLDQDALRDLAERYRVPQVIVALGKLVEKDGEQQLLVRLVDGYLDGRGDNRRRLETGASDGLYDSGDGYGASFDQGATRRSAGTPGQTLAEAFFRAPEGDFPKLAKRAVESTVATYADDWKSRTLVDHSAVRAFEMTAWFDGLDEWAEIRTALGATPLVRRMAVGAFTAENAVMQVEAIGRPAQFELAMRQQGLTAWRARDGWYIAEAERARGVQARLPPLSAEAAATLDREAEARLRPLAPGAGRPYDPAGGEIGAFTPDAGPIDASSGVTGRAGSDVQAPTEPGVPELPDELFGEDQASPPEEDDPFLGDY